MIKKILIANRGEIAVRIIRTCKEMGISTVAVYSSCDKEALHVQLADRAVCIGGPRARDSYLNMYNIIQAACNTGCDAIHPGFGFLSENPGFARLVQECGLIFIGPSADIIEKMGDKAMARQTMISAGVPVVPGSRGTAGTLQEGISQAGEIGYPVMIKAVNGGGGRGMRTAYSDAEFAAAYNAARSEAMACFGSDRVYVEKYIPNPKHIEVQIAGDNYGNVIHLYERDCSYQRRNQKMIEEAPCFILDRNTRQSILDDAVKAASFVGYNSVGTVEFLLDEFGNHYFMEMNTRIQVEHPITEMVCGVDIVKLQIKAAANRHLDIKQEDVHCSGYAVECRINAENPAENFAPSAGRVEFVNFPGGRNVRVDSAVYNGCEIQPFYDSMIAKIITWAPTRLECIKKMRAALEEMIVSGVSSNVEFQYMTLHHRKFIEGKYTTAFAREFTEELRKNGNLV